MGLSQKQRDALLKSKKRRAMRPRPAAPLPTATMGHRERHRYTEQHPRVLLSIEQAINSVFRKNQTLDDIDVEKGLVALIYRRELAADPKKTIRMEVLAALQTARSEWKFPNDTDADQIWTDGLRAILTSVKNQSSGLPGSTGYIEKAAAFLRQTASRQ